MVVWIGGVCGVGKTAVAKECSKQVGNSCFLDADDFHSVENKNKMKLGIPLSDSDRKPWLDELIRVIQQRAVDSQREARQGYCIFCACSVLKLAYRQYLRNALRHSVTKCIFILLTGSTQVLLHRLNSRQGHFMPPNLLSSQLEALELLSEEEKALGDEQLDTSDQTISQLVSSIIQKIGLES